MKPVLLINPNSSVETTEAMVVIARQHLAEVQGWTNDAAPSIITDPGALAKAADYIAGAALPPCSAVIVAAFGDPGAEALAARLDVPVVGIGAAAARAAGEGGAPFAVVTTTPKLAPSIDALMQSQASGYLGCFLTEGDPQALTADPAALDLALIRGCARAAEAGASRVIIGGGPLASAAIRIAGQVPLVQPIVAACHEIAARTGHPGPPAPDAGRSRR